MESISFKQKFDRRAKYLTALSLVACLAIFVWLLFRSTASFISAWFAVLSVSLILLVWIGMPKKTILTDYGIRISCTLKLVTIDNVDKITIEKIIPYSFPLFSTMGFMGYVGYYYFKKEKFSALVMARSKDNLVLVRYGENRKLVIGVPDVEKFLDTAAELGYKIVKR